MRFSFGAKEEESFWKIIETLESTRALHFYENAIFDFDLGFLGVRSRPARNCLVSNHLLVMASKDYQNIDIVSVLVMK